MNQYNPSEIEKKWQEKWEKAKVFSPDLDKAKNPFFNLMMFPYPSAEGMHVGNMYAFTGADVYGRFQRMSGNDVFEPIGLDGFGIHSENYALKVGRHPAEQAEISEKNFYRQLHSIGNSYDWNRTVETYKPEYYHWTQWLFIQLFNAGLAYKKKAPVNFCPKDLTVLADEQVEGGLCERCGSVVEKRELEQWFFKITDYAEKLLGNIEGLNWTEKVKIAQRNWIGRSEGAVISFEIPQLDCQINVFTTRPDTLFGATFLVLSPEHPFIKALISQNAENQKTSNDTEDIYSDIDIQKIDTKIRKELSEYVKKSQNKSEDERKENKEKSGVFTGFNAVNPVNGEEIPVWVSDYVLSGYGTGAIMAVPAHDERDFEFAKKFDLPIKEVIGGGDIRAKAYEGDGEIINSQDWNGWKTPESISKVISWLEEKGLGKKQINYHLRDWLISRQRYWGPPIPMIHCEKCGWNPVPEEDLPVLLPEVEDYKPKGNGKSPLANIESFVSTTCPKCGGEAKRETDVSDSFVDSCWYFFRYTSTDIENNAFDIERVKKWLPVNMYIGGAEHSVLHLLYARFITMVLHDLKFIDFEEPFSRFFAHGLIIKDGAKMSKSKGNVIVPDQYIAKFGADTLRCYLMFLGPFSAGGDFRDSGMEGMNRFLKRVWKMIESAADVDSDSQMLNKTVKKVTEDVSELRYNTAIAGLMECYNALSKKDKISKEEAKVFLKLLAPFAPHMTEELWEKLGETESIHLQNWPKFDEGALVENEINIAVSVNGKARGVIMVSADRVDDQNFIEQKAKENANVSKFLDGVSVAKVIYVPGKIINFVTK